MPAISPPRARSLKLPGAHKKLDYLGAFSWLQTANNLPNGRVPRGHFVRPISAGRSTATTQLRATLHYGVDATGVPNAWDFYHVADDATEKDQNLFLSASDRQPDHGQPAQRGPLRAHAQARAGFSLDHLGESSPSLRLPPIIALALSTLGNTVTITGANGYSATGQAVLDCSTYRAQYVNNRDHGGYQGDITFTPHLAGLIGLQYEDERGAEPGSTYYKPVKRTNYVVPLAVHGDFKERFFYALGGSLEHYSLFGFQASPRAGLNYYVLRPRSGVFSGTRIFFNFGKAVREPKLADQDDSLYNFLSTYNPSAIQTLHIGPLAAPAMRTYEGGIEQAFLSQHVIFRTSYFHNEFGKEIEYVGLDLIPELVPNLSAAQQATLEEILQANYAYELTINSEAFRAQGIETSVESGIGSSIFLRGGYTYLDAVVQRSFTNDDEALLGPIPTFDGIPCRPLCASGGRTPLPPRAAYRLLFSHVCRQAVHRRLHRRLCQPQRRLHLPGRRRCIRRQQPAFAQSQSRSRLRQARPGLERSGLSLDGPLHPSRESTNNQHIAPIGYPSLPITVRSGLRLRWGTGQRALRPVAADLVLLRRVPVRLVGALHDGPQPPFGGSTFAPAPSRISTQDRP